MTSVKVSIRVWGAVALLVLLPALASAQSTIAGVVRDTSGAVLPGVTVEVASDVLIEKTRSASTDGEGRYSIIDLRPGTYSVTFTLTGFSIVKREERDRAVERDGADQRRAAGRVARRNGHRVRRSRRSLTSRTSRRCRS